MPTLILLIPSGEIFRRLTRYGSGRKSRAQSFNQQRAEGEKERERKKLADTQLERTRAQWKRPPLLPGHSHLTQ